MAALRFKKKKQKKTQRRTQEGSATQTDLHRGGSWGNKAQRRNKTIPRLTVRSKGGAEQQGPAGHLVCFVPHDAATEAPFPPPCEGAR